ncbi:MAG: hypothetical protein J5493_00595 [Lachnospiraceae bacterium]|nr:hypothetical protein [Lachnospiraceae bacterium]
MKKWILVIVLAVAAVLVVLALIPAGTIRYEGNAYYEEEELTKRVFGDSKPRYFVALLQEKLGRHKEIPFVDHYDVQFGPGRDITVRLYERSLAGYLRFQDYNLYFDWSGTVVESSRQQVDGVFEVTGLGVDYAVVGKRLPVADSTAIDSILTISQFLKKESVAWNGTETPLASLAKRIRFSSDGVSVDFGDIEVLLGSAENMDAKLFLMADILPELAGRKGTLYLDNYQSGAVRPHYVFKEKQPGE